MKMLNTLIIVFLFSYFNLLCGTYSGGDGSIGNPYKIADINDLEELMDTHSDWNSSFILIANINCNGHSWANDNPRPIGNGDGTSSTTPFLGDFNGQNFTISNILYNLSSTENVGFFGYLGTISNAATISNLNLSNVNVDAYKNAGVMCGVVQHAKIKDCSATGDVDSYEENSGGFCGIMHDGLIKNCSATGNAVCIEHSSGGFCGLLADGTIENCSASGNATVNDIYCAGGFCGHIYDGTIAYCIASGNAYTRGDYAGGFCGYNKYGTITDCIAMGNAEAGIIYAGGFCGMNVSGTITNCTASGDAESAFACGGFCGASKGILFACSSSGNSNAKNFLVGGFIGAITNGIIDCCFSVGNAYAVNQYSGGFCGGSYNSTVSNCYSKGMADANTNIGGFCGIGENSIFEYCYSIGEPTGTANVGGFLGTITTGSTFTCCYWGCVSATLDDIGSSGDDPDITELTPIQMSNPMSFPCFDLDNIWVMGFNVSNSDYSYPMLREFNATLIPTLTEWAVIIFIGLLAGVGGWFVWRRM